MNLLDIVLIIIVFAFIYKGAQQGITYMIGQAVGIIVGVLIASRVFDDLAHLIQPLFLGNYAIAAIFSFVLIFEIINELLGLVLKTLNVFGFLRNLPIFGTLDKWIGALLGLFVGNLILGVILFFLIRTPSNTFLDELLKTSSLTPLFINFATWFIALFPNDFKMLPTVIEKEL